MPTIMVLLWIFVMLVTYLLPAYVASARHHNNAGPILALDLFLGWTFLGWVGALVRSLNNNVDKKPDADQMDRDSERAQRASIPLEQLRMDLRLLQGGHQDDP